MLVKFKILTCAWFNYPDFAGGASDNSGLIEICRKPSYKYFYTDTFTVCVNHAFNFNVHSTNATTFQWKKNGATLATQTDSILNFTNITYADSGSYTCEMVNQCGATITMALQLNVSACTGLDDAIGLQNAIAVFPNPANNVLNLKILNDKNIRVQKLLIKNMLGQVVYDDEKNYLHVDISKLTNGIYTVQLITDKGNWQSRFVKDAP